MEKVKKHTEYMREYRKLNRDKINSYQREWRKRNNYTEKYFNKNRERINKLKRNNKKRPEVRQKITKEAREYKKRPYVILKDKARKIAYNKIKIPKGQLCQICNKAIAKERHHKDYKKPLEVVFLCLKCHVNLHPIKNKRGLK